MAKLDADTPIQLTFHKLIVLMVTTRDADRVKHLCVTKFGYSEKDAEKAIAKAIEAITLAADFDRREEIGTAVYRFNDLYEKTSSMQDHKTALAAENSRCKVLGLYATADHVAYKEPTDNMSEEEAMIRCYLLPHVGNEETSTVELARLAALKLTDHINA